MSGPAEDSSYGRELSDAQRFAAKDARIRKLEDDLAAAREEIRRLNDICDRLAAAGRRSE